MDADLKNVDLENIKPVHAHVVADKSAANILLQVGPDATRVNVLLVAKHSTPDQPLLENRIIDILHMAGQRPVDDTCHRQLANVIRVLHAAAGGADIFEVAALPSSETSVITGTEDLQTVLFPEPVHTCLETIDGKPTLTWTLPDARAQISNGPVRHHWWAPDKDVPRFLAKQVIPYDGVCKGDGFKGRVFVAGQLLFCRAKRGGLNDHTLFREIDALQGIRRGILSGMVFPGPGLAAVVKDTYSGAVIGLLRAYVETNPWAPSLAHLNMSMISQEFKNKWAEQLASGVQQLHQFHVTWGDAKPEDILVNTQGDIQVINLGRGGNLGWEDDDADTEETEDAEERDDLALVKILRFIHQEEEYEANAQQGFLYQKEEPEANAQQGFLYQKEEPEENAQQGLL